MNKFIKYLIESVDDDEFFSDLGYDTGKEITFLVDDNLYKYFPENIYELQEYIREHLDRGDNDLNDIDTSKIVDMSNLFEPFNVKNDNYDLSKIDISGWNVSNVKSMYCMFWGCINFNSDLSRWNVSKVENMSNMFCNCANFNSDISEWNVSNVTNMNEMFYECKTFNSNISNWDVSNVNTMYGMFAYCNNFNSDISNWDVSNVKIMAYMFYKCTNFNSNISNWIVNNVKVITNMFLDCNIREEYKP